MENLLLCKICEHPIVADKLHSHSIKCKEAAEVKQKIFTIKENLFVLINKAYHIKTQLNTNVAIQKSKKKKQEDLGIDSASKAKSNSGSPLVFATKFKKTDRQATRMSLPYVPTEIKIDGLDMIKSDSEPISDQKMQLFEEEFSKAMIAIKGILYYGTCLSKGADEIDEDTACDLKIKNEIHSLYSEIRDKKISQYLQKFLDTLQDYIVHKRKYDKKTIEIESISKPSGDTPHGSTLRQNKGRHKRHVSAVKALILKEFSEDSSPKINSPSLSRFQSTASNSKRATVFVDPANNEEFTKGLKSSMDRKQKTSKFSWVPEGSVTTRDKIETALARTDSNNWAESSEKFTKSEHNQKVQRQFLKEFKGYIKGIKDISFSPEHRRRNIKRDKTRKVSERLKKSHSLLVPVKLGSEKSDLESETDSNGSQITDKKEKEGNITDSNKKSQFASKKRYRRKRFSLKDIYRGEDIQTLVDKSLQLTVNKQQTSPIENLNRKKGEKKYEDQYITLTMKGYYSDSALNERRKVEMEKTQNIGIDDFDFLKFLGQGAYGRIYLVRKKSTGDQYAMKIVDFADMETTQNKFASLKTERNVYQSIMGEWVVKAYYTFSYQNYICFVLEYMIGGDLASLLEQIGCFDECVARFYFAELILALESLHKLGIIHRDLKPDNILIDAEGHIKLTDFGLSEQGLNKLKKMATINSNNTSLRDFASSRSNLSRKTMKNNLPSSSNVQNTPHSTTSPQSKLTLSSINDNNSHGRFTSHLNSLKAANGPMDPYIVRNKMDEEVIFTFLEEGGMTKWLSLNRLPIKNDKVANPRKKEVFRIIGTPDYMAPEIINGEACNRKSIDIWGLGVILYELLIGVTPFNDETVDKVFDNITNLKMDWPQVGFGEDCITVEASDLIEKLLRLEPTERLTLSEIKAHPFFEGWDWDRVKDILAPIVPHKKEDHEGPKNFLKPQTIFEDRKNTLPNNVNMKEINSFNMKRVDLLHQLNEETYLTLK